MTERIKFYDPESGAERAGDIMAQGYIGEQYWNKVQDEKGVRWMIPTGSPNNCSPICEESEPEAYHEINEQIG